MLILGGKSATSEDARNKLKAAIANGDAIRVMEKMVAAQHGDAKVVADPSLLKVANETVSVKADRDGFVTTVDALEIGLAGVAMGAGRTRADQKVDPLVGISVLAKPGKKVSRGEELALLHVHKASDADAVKDRIAAAFEIGEKQPDSRSLLIDRVV
jgi:pyrimidine-nucleoside phosphorylase